MKPLTRLFRLLLITLLTPVLFLLGCQSRLIYYPRGYDENYRQTLTSHRGVAIPYTTGQGAQVAHYIPPKKGGQNPKALWICFAGNGSLGLDWLNYVDQWDPSFAYLMVDYPGYGDCKGIPSPRKIRESSLAAFDALAKHLNQSPEQLRPRLGVVAHSIGCAAGLMAASELNISKIVLISPFTTMTDMGKLLLGWPLCHVNMHRFDNRRELAQVVEQGAKVVIFHGTADEVIPISMSRELAEAHPGRVTLYEKEGWDHNRILHGVSQEIGAAMSSMVKP
ncbi:alpha/beta hydrolase family protein [Prosthecobacter fusiformis]|uniref:Alpha/beta hydrolase family protein n=1 Tax=Prosthecobacter fusiformis TaxID=48464 RepID=A0A4V3FE97_9BACT|nr:alpha/beta fold hydrolase [Prosthecobacter fusiformis]TDU66093.1 alpha/beta hydrolase family protein [Prosthecobacter fusiformis]